MSYFLYVASAGEDRISIWEMDRGTGDLAFLENVALAGGPSPLAVDPGQQFMYAGLRATREMASLHVDRATGHLSLLARIPLEFDPCYLALDRTGRFLLSAYYAAGMVGVHAIGPDGVAQNPPIEWRTTLPKAHSMQTDRSNRFAFVPHVGESNTILQFRFDAHTGHLTPNAVPSVVPEPGAGPRHYCFHPTLDVLYFSNEQGCSVTAYRLDPATGTLAAFQTVPTLPEGTTVPNTCAQIQIAPSGRFLYAPNRGHNSIACFQVDPKTGHLSAAGHQPTEPVPRALTVDPSGHFVYAAGLDSGRLAAYRIDERSGTLWPLRIYEVGARPMWVLALDLAG
jgi:6-phosphogluconolactonase